jgi:hypothetical protein
LSLKVLNSDVSSGHTYSSCLVEQGAKLNVFSITFKVTDASSLVGVLYVEGSDSESRALNADRLGGTDHEDVATWVPYTDLTNGGEAVESIAITADVTDTIHLTRFASEALRCRFECTAGSAHVEINITRRRA